MQTQKYAVLSELANYQQKHANQQKEPKSRVMRQVQVYAQCNHSASQQVPRQNWQQRMRQIACNRLFSN